LLVIIFSRSYPRKKNCIEIIFGHAMDKHLFIVNGQDGPAIHRVQKLVVVEPT